MSEPTQTRVFVTDHHVVAADVTAMYGEPAYVAGSRSAFGITIDGDKPREFVERDYTWTSDPMPPLGQVDTWPIVTHRREVTETRLTVEPA